MKVLTSAGMAIGIVVGLIICVFIFKAVNKDHRIKTEYDERQKAIKGRGYTYGFYTLLVYEAIMLIFSVGGYPELPITEYMWHAVGIYLGVTVVCVHAIWNRAYWGLNNDHKQYIIVVVVCFILNMLPLIG
ncbi:MAG: hypothetical protein K6B14_09795, partial [Lachnospiraceae bacterium]|nr:hypothetical protein [Lachnospiraceae bacterium]